MLLQVQVESIGLVGFILFLVIVSELMVRNLAKGIQSVKDSLEHKLQGSVAYTLFKRKRVLWRGMHAALWISIGILFGLILDFVIPMSAGMYIAPVCAAYFIGSTRESRVSEIAVRIEYDLRWEQVTQELSEHKQIINSPRFAVLKTVGRIKKLELAAKEARGVFVYGVELGDQEIIEARFREHLKFLVGLEGEHIAYDIEEIYVLLYILSEGNDEVATLARQMLLEGIEIDSSDVVGKEGILG